MSSILEKIDSSEDVKKLNEIERQILCGELRENIINVVSVNGGHLASNLGVVELTLALLTVFSPPADSIVWDVGHQIYTHKLLTGRKDKFSTIRTENGLSGFPSREESPCDPFTTGHSSTSISSALGIATANSIKNNAAHTVAIIGDGSLSGGLAFEGLNNAGHIKKNFIVILNDNKMSISKGVGSIAKYLTFIRTRPGYLKAKIDVEKSFEKIPMVGKKLASGTRRIKGFVRKTIYASTIFEDMGFSYYGPYDGHDTEMLIGVLENAKKINKPVLIHVKTMKGKGYNFAENSPNIFHGVSSFNTQNGKIEPSSRSFSSVFGEHLVEMAKSDKRICAVTAAMASGTGLVNFSTMFKERFFDVGIAEGHAATFSGGLASKGLIPFFAVYSTFLQRAYDSLIHDISLQNDKVILAIDRAGIVGEDGRTHNGVFDIAYLRTIPDCTIYSPSYFDELTICMDKSAELDTGLVAIRYPRGNESYRPSNYRATTANYTVIGEESSKLAVVCFGRTFSNCAQAVESFVDTNIKIKIIKLNRIWPTPDGALNSILNSEKVLFLEEGIKAGGISEALASLLMENGYKGTVKINAINNGFIRHAPMNRILEELRLDTKGIKEALLELNNMGEDEISG